jgi:hypothetical protein
MSDTTTTKSLTATDVKHNIMNSKGQFVTALWESEVKPAAAHKGHTLTKKSRAVVRAGINFANLSSVKEGIESGERGPVQELPWGEWKLDAEGKSMFPYVITHKDQDYIRLYPSDTKTKTTYYLDGNEVTKEKFCEYLTPSEAKKILDGEKPECFTVKESNIRGIEDFEG